MKCMIVDDEPLARELLESYILQIDELKLVKSSSNAIEAFTFMQYNPVDLLFLCCSRADVGRSGLPEFLRLPQS